MTIKKIIICLFCFVTVNIFGQNFSMYLYTGEKLCYKISESKMLVKSKTLDTDGIKNALQNTKTGSLRKIDDLDGQLYMVEMQNLRGENLIELVRQWNAREDVIYASPVFGDEMGSEGTGYSNEVIVRLKSEDDYPILQKYAEIYHIKDVEYDDLLYAYKLTLPHNPQKDAMQTALELYETGLFLYAEPNLFYIRPWATVDTYYSNQWGLKNIGQTVGGVKGTIGVDINVEPAWTITTGSSNIKVAIIDMGVDLNHPDLAGKLVLPGYNALNNTNNGSPTNTTSGDFAHGTKCAGVVVAQANNNMGIAGVAYGCKVMPVVAGQSGGINADAAARGINWAWHNGADVISMSYGGYNPTSSQLLAIDSAIVFGRNGKGCVLVACTHNYGNTNVTFPASSDKVIGVGAIIQTGQRRSDSNYGNGLDVVAPGDNIYTTGMLNNGSNQPYINDGSKGVYFSNFCATSAATPHVAGIAALILSVNPNLQQSQVRNYIESTCNKKLPGFTNSQNKPNGTWNTHLGYGLVNAFHAVGAATCVSSYSNQTVSTHKAVYGCSNLAVQNVTVNSGGTLTLAAPNGVSVTGTFSVSGILEMQ